MTKKPWSWRKKLVVSLFVGVILLYTAGLFSWLKWGYDSTIPKGHVFPSTAELARKSKVKEQFEESIGFHIPELAGDIFLCECGGRDRVNFCSFILPSEKIRKFAEEFAGVPLSQFHKGGGFQWSEISNASYVMRGPAIWRGGEKWKTVYWNLTELKNCIYFEIVDFVTLGDGSKKETRKRFIVIDEDTNRVYLCIP